MGAWPRWGPLWSGTGGHAGRGRLPAPGSLGCSDFHPGIAQNLLVAGDRGPRPPLLLGPWLWPEQLPRDGWPWGMGSLLPRVGLAPRLEAGQSAPLWWLLLSWEAGEMSVLAFGWRLWAQLTLPLPHLGEVRLCRFCALRPASSGQGLPQTSAKQAAVQGGAGGLPPPPRVAVVEGGQLHARTPPPTCRGALSPLPTFPVPRGLGALGNARPRGACQGPGLHRASLLGQLEWSSCCVKG